MSTEGCVYVFKKGKRKDEKCGRKIHGNLLCKLHYKEEKSLDILPCVILSKIFGYLTDNVKLLHVLEASSKRFRDIIRKDIYDKCVKEHNLNLPVKKYLELYTNIGCQHCGKARIRKVYTEYGVRYCTDCLYNHTISDYKLKKEYNIDRPDLLKNVRQNTVEMYHRKLGSYFATFYWTADVIKIIKDHFDCSLEEYSERWFEMNRKENDEKLVEYCQNKNLSAQDIIKHTNYKDASKYPIKYFDNFYRETVKALRKIEINEFLKKFPEYKTYKDDIKQSRYLNNLHESSTLLSDTDWIRIKTEIDSIRYERHYETFCDSFGNRRKVQQLEYVIDKYVAKTYFTNQDKDIINELLGLKRDGKNLKCKYCPPTSTRLFTIQGLKDHCHAVHTTFQN